jgi:hypothetical protein
MPTRQAAHAACGAAAIRQSAQPRGSVSAGHGAQRRAGVTTWTQTHPVSAVGRHRHAHPPTHTRPRTHALFFLKALVASLQHVRARGVINTGARACATNSHVAQVCTVAGMHACTAVRGPPAPRPPHAAVCALAAAARRERAPQQCAAGTRAVAVAVAAVIVIMIMIIDIIKSCSQACTDPGRGAQSDTHTHAPLGQRPGMARRLVHGTRAAQSHAAVYMLESGAAPRGQHQRTTRQVLLAVLLALMVAVCASAQWPRVCPQWGARPPATVALSRARHKQSDRQSGRHACSQQHRRARCSAAQAAPDNAQAALHTHTHRHA